MSLSRGRPRALLPYGLTPREMQVLRCLCEGMSNGAIRDALSIRENTVKRFLQSIGEKTGQSTRLEIVLFALRKGLASLGITQAEYASVVREIERQQVQLEKIHQRIERDIVRSRSLTQQLVQKQKEILI